MKKNRRVTMSAERPAFSAADLVQLLRILAKPDDGYLDAVEDVIGDQPKVPKSE